MSQSVASAVTMSSENKKGIFVSITESDIPKDIQESFVILRLVRDTRSFKVFEECYGEMYTSYCVVSGKEMIDVFSDFDFDVKAVVERCLGWDYDDRLVAVQEEAVQEEAVQEEAVQEEAVQDQTNVPEVQEPTDVPAEVTKDVPSEAPTVFDAQESQIEKHQREFHLFDKQKKEEIQRLRKLLEYDQKERVAQHEYELIRADHITKSAPKITNECALSIRLIDGSVLKQNFKNEDTLDVVRKWLDVDSGVEILPPIALPAFAKPSSADPIRYVFHSPAPPRATYTDMQEFELLELLNLSPRSVIVLKPIYLQETQTASAAENVRSMRRAIFSTVGSGINKVGNALYSFFDYSVADIQEDDETEESFLEQPIEMSRAGSPIFTNSSKIISRVQTILDERAEL